MDTILFCVVICILSLPTSTGKQLDKDIHQSDALTYKFQQRALLGTTAKAEGCQCATSSCQCCKTLKIQRGSFRLQKLVCVKLVYDKSSVEVDVEVTVDGGMIIHQKMKVKNPQPVCGMVNIPKLGTVKACIHFVNLKLDNTGISGCLTGRATGKVSIGFNIGCFNIPGPGKRWIKRRYVHDIVKSEFDSQLLI